MGYDTCPIKGRNVFGGMAYIELLQICPSYAVYQYSKLLSSGPLSGGVWQKSNLHHHRWNSNVCMHAVRSCVTVYSWSATYNSLIVSRTLVMHAVRSCVTVYSWSATYKSLIVSRTLVSCCYDNSEDGSYFPVQWLYQSDHT